MLNYNNNLIDKFKFIFACLIPILHIAFPQNLTVLLIREYICRLGVPFFFAVSGYFLTKSIISRGEKEAFRIYFFRICTILGFWGLCYLPFFLSGDLSLQILQVLIFKTPGFLWYLTALLFASPLFCYIKPSKKKTYLALILYFVGTMFSDSYSWFIKGFEVYENIFLTTRNGLFFGFPLMCVGGIVFSTKEYISLKHALLGLAITYFFLCLEITLVISKTNFNTDRSMYLFLMPVIYFILSCLINFQNSSYTNFFRKSSSAIYVTQFGIIWVTTKALAWLGITGAWMSSFIIYFLILIFGIFTWFIFRNNKFLKRVF